MSRRFHILIFSLLVASPAGIFASQECLNQIIQVSKKSKFKLVLKELPIVQTERMKKFPNIESVQAGAALTPVPGLPYIFSNDDYDSGSSLIKLNGDTSTPQWEIIPGFTNHNFGSHETKLGANIVSDRYIVFPHESWLGPYPRANGPLNNEILVIDHQNPTAPTRILKIDGAELRTLHFSPQYTRYLENSFDRHHRALYGYYLKLAPTKPYMFISFDTGKILKIDLRSGKVVGRLDHLADLESEKVLQVPTLDVGEDFMVAHSTGRTTAQLIDIKKFEVIRELPRWQGLGFSPKNPELIYNDASTDEYIFTKNHILRIYEPTYGEDFRELPNDSSNWAGEYMRLSPEQPREIDIHSFHETSLNQLQVTFEGIDSIAVAKDESSFLVVEHNEGRRKLVLRAFNLKSTEELLSKKIISWQSKNGEATVRSSVLSLSDGSYLVAAGVWEPIFSHPSQVEQNKDGSITVNLEMDKTKPNPADPGAGELVLFHVSKNKVKQIYQQPLPYPIEFLQLNEFGQLLIRYDSNKIAQAKVAEGTIPPHPGIHVFSVEME
ncbi:MAG: hypothetical protein JWQ35_341 [Bacteriovoracaceae bacterium]|nr:hypothetical protein [Bacteriovoracaceae bacterium]